MSRVVARVEYAMLENGTRQTSDRTANRTTSAAAGAGPGRSLIPGIPRRVHLLGAGGAGVSGAARVLVDHGHILSGHDRAESEHVELLRSLGVCVQVGPQNAAQLPAEVEMVIRSAAVANDDAVVREALAARVPVLKYAEALGRITPIGRTLAIAGTHGKTTSSWMVHHALRGLSRCHANVSRPMPGAIVGGVCRELGTNAISAELDGWFAVEACEYDYSFLQLSPRGAVITNIEADHLDCYGDLENIKNAFAKFANRIHPDGMLVVGRDVAPRVEEAARCPVWRLGREVKIDLLGERSGCFTFRLKAPSFVVPSITLPVPGHFNVENAACALALVVGLAAREWALDNDEAARAAARGLEGYRGSLRRFEPWGSVGGIDVVHDYAHHPTEVRVTLEAARRVFPGRPLHVLFQPHQHSRTARFLGEFVQSLRMADKVVVADVYGARAHIDGEHQAGSKELVEGLVGFDVVAVAGGDIRFSLRAACETLPMDSALLVLGAGDIVDIKDDLIAELAVCRAVRRGSLR